MNQRVLHIIGRMDRAGAETMLMNIYRKIDRSRFQFDFVYFTTDRCDYDDEIESLGGQIYRLAAKNTITRFLELQSLLRSGTWVIIHSHTLFSSALHLLAGRLAGVPLRIAHSHSTQDANSNSLLGRLYQHGARTLIARLSTHRMACGQAAAEYLFPTQCDVILIQNAVDVEQFASESRDVIRSNLGLREDQLVIVQVGRFMPVKNHSRSVSIAKALQNAGVDFKLLFIGKGQEENQIKELISNQGLEEFVKPLGLRSDIPKLMAAADVMLMPSLYEGFPVVLVESQAAGLPSVISSAISKEVDLGLELVHFVELEAPDEHWVSAILKAAKSNVPNVSSRLKVLDAAGYSSAASAKRLEAVYEVSCLRT